MARGPQSVIQGQITEVSQDGNGVTIDGRIKAWYSKFRNLPRYPIGTVATFTCEAVGDKGTLYIQDLQVQGNAQPMMQAPATPQTNGYAQPSSNGFNGQAVNPAMAALVGHTPQPNPYDTSNTTLTPSLAAPASRELAIIRQSSAGSAARLLAGQTDVSVEQLLQFARAIENYVLDPESHLDSTPQQLALMPEPFEDLAALPF